MAGPSKELQEIRARLLLRGVEGAEKMTMKQCEAAEKKLLAADEAAKNEQKGDGGAQAQGDGPDKPPVQENASGGDTGATTQGDGPDKPPVQQQAAKTRGDGPDKPPAKEATVLVEADWSFEQKEFGLKMKAGDKKKIPVSQFKHLKRYGCVRDVTES